MISSDAISAEPSSASVITLRHGNAARAWVAMAVLNYTIRTNTSNGVNYAAPVTFDTFQIDTVLHTDVPAVVMPRSKVPISLLGQSFTIRLASFRFDGDQLVL